MTPWLWAIAAVLGLAMFGLGCIFARAALVRRGGHDKALRNSHANTILGTFFSVIAIAVAADTIHLQTQLSRFSRGQVECNRATLEAQIILSEQRRNVDTATTDYLGALHDWLLDGAPTDPDSMSFDSLHRTLHTVQEQRALMARTYVDHPFPRCGTSR